MRGEKNTLATHLGVANICPSKRLATEERNSYYSSRKGYVSDWRHSVRMISVNAQTTLNAF